MKATAATTIKEYIKTAPKSVQPTLQKLYDTIKKTAPGAVESISYQMPAFKLNGKPLVYFAAWEHHIGFYATPSSNAAFKKELSKYKSAKGSVQFPLDQPMPWTLIKKMVQYKAKELLLLKTKSKK